MPDTNVAKPRPLIVVLARERQLLAALPLGLLLVGILYVVLRPARYVSESTVRPLANQDQSTQLSGLAAQFGLAVPNAGDPIKLYAEIAESHSLLADVLTTAYPANHPQQQGQTLLERAEPSGDTPTIRLRRAVEWLRKRVDVTANEGTGTLRVRVTGEEPRLVEQVNRRILALVDSASMRLRRQQASAERSFVAARLADAQSELRRAEEALEAFYRTNRSWQGSPHLQAEFGRLQRVVDFRQQVAVGLAQSLEQASIDAVRNTPVLGIIDPPEGTARPLNRARDVILWPIAGLILALAIALLRDGLRVLTARYPLEVQQFRDMLRR